MKIVIFIINSILLVSCFEQKVEHVINEPLVKPPLIDIQSFHLDTLHLIERTSFTKDSFEYEEYYPANKSQHLIYHKSGKIFDSNKKSAITMYSVSDTIVRINLLVELNKQWKVVDSAELQILGFSPSSFGVEYADYNLDNVNDLNILFYSSMSVAYSHGYLIIVDITKNKMTLIKGSIDIPNLSMNNKRIESITHNHPGHEPIPYKKTKEYEIVEDSIILLKTTKVYL